MNRSRFTIRLMFLTLAAGLVLMAINPLIRWFVVRNAPAITGANVKVDHVRSSLGNASIVLHGVQIGDPQQSSKNNLDADKVSLHLNWDALTRRQFVVETGLVEGLKFTIDDSAGGLDFERSKAVASDLSNRGKTLGDQLLTNVIHEPQMSTADLQTPQLANDLLASWDENHHQLEQTAQQTRQRISALREYLQAAGENPLRNIDEYRSAVVELETMHKQITETRAAVARLEQQLLLDKEALDHSFQLDIARAQQTGITRQLNKQDMTQYLLAPEVGGQVAAALQWLQWSRRFMPGARNISAPGRIRGHNVNFPGAPAARGLIRKLVLGGSGEIAGRKVQIEGIAQNLSSNPSTSGPADVTLHTSGDTLMVVKATLGKVEGVSHDTILVEIPNLANRARTLGSADHFAVTVSPTTARLWAKFEIHGEELAGQLVFSQHGVALTPHVADRFGGEQIAQILSNSLRNVDTLETVVELAGTVDQPQWRLQSDLGGQFSEALVTAYQSQSQAQRHRFVAESNEQVKNRVATAEQGLAAQRMAMLQYLDTGNSEIDEVKAFIATRVERNDGVLNERDPVRETFRR